MILALPFLLAAFAGPDPAPALDAVKTCDRGAMMALTRAEPRRRAEWAAAAYAEQQGIARERGALLAPGTAATTAAGKAGFDLALTGLDARQKQLDDARAVELSWRALVDELRADFLANCAQTKGGKD
ncbi:MAG: hypothetical protein ACKOPE_14290 [Novosphingobium sp.]